MALVPANTLPKTPLGGIHLSETKQLFLEGSLHPCNVLMCPHTCVTNLPKPRQKQPGMAGSTTSGEPMSRASGFSAFLLFTCHTLLGRDHLPIRQGLSTKCEGKRCLAFAGTSALGADEILHSHQQGGLWQDTDPLRILLVESPSW